MTAHDGIRARDDGWKLNGWHVLFILIGFFGVVFAVNGIFVKVALGTYSGTVSNEAYVKGIHYNDRIAAGERQTALGWTETMSVGLDGLIALEMRDGAGAPVSGLSLKGSIGRSATDKLDRPVTLAEAEPGRYVANVGALEPGDWVVALSTTKGGKLSEPVYRLRRRLWLKR